MKDIQRSRSGLGGVTKERETSKIYIQVGSIRMYDVALMFKVLPDVTSVGGVLDDHVVFTPTSHCHCCSLKERRCTRT